MGGGDASKRRQIQVSTKIRDLRWTLSPAPPENVPEENYVRLHNVVATANFGEHIDLERLAWKHYATYQPRTFSAVHIRLKEPSSTALVFSSGRIVCTGAQSEYAALCAINVYLRMVQEIQPAARIVSYTIQNLVGVGKLKHPVKIDEMARALILRNTVYDPEIFPGLRMKLRYPAMNALVFCSGKAVLTGARSRNDIAKAWAALCIIVEPYMYTGAKGEECPTHRSIAIARNASKKRKI